MKSEIIQEQPEDTAIEYPCLMQWEYGNMEIRWYCLLHILKVL